MVRVGIIGTGGISQMHGRGLAAASDRLDLIAACDTDPTALSRFSREFGVANCYSNYRELLDSPDADAVIVLLPHDLHETVCVEALNRGKHVLVDKPIARTLGEADTIIAAAEKSGTTLMVGFNQRFQAVNRQIRRLLEAGAIGDVFAARIDHHQDFDRPRGHWWRSKDAVGGGCVIGSGIHRLDLLRWFLGEATEVFAYAVGDPDRLEAEVGCVATLKFGEGTIAEFFCNWGVYQDPRRAYDGERLFLFGKKGHLFLDAEGRPAMVGGQDQAKADELITQVRAEVAGESMWEHFADCIENRTRPLTNGAEGRRSLALVDAIYRSVEKGRPVSPQDV
jgi:predicted dehydrogenase